MIGSLAPCSSDGKPIVLASLLPKDAAVNFTGAGDDVANGARFNGIKLQIQSNGVEDKTLEFQYIEWVYIIRGLVRWEGAVFGDEISAETYAPATVGISNPGAGAYNKVALGPGRNLYVPAAPGTFGNWDLNLLEKFNAKVGFTKVVPVPTYSNNGFFDWDEDTELVTVNAAGKGGFNLFDFDLRVNRYMNCVQLIGAGWEEFSSAMASPKKILAHWKTRLILHNSTAKVLSATCTMAVARKFTT